MSLKASDSKITAIDRFIHQALFHYKDAENEDPGNVNIEENLLEK